MRKWYWFGGLAVALGVGVGSWYLGGSQLDPVVALALRVAQSTSRPIPEADGDAEKCETIEPLVVEGNAPVAVCKPGPIDWEAPRVAWAPGVVQAPRPDMEPGQVLRMPYADEDSLPILFNPLTLHERAWQQNIFDELLKQGDPAEEAENTEPAPLPVETPEPERARRCRTIIINIRTAQASAAIARRRIPIIRSGNHVGRTFLSAIAPEILVLPAPRQNSQTRSASRILKLRDALFFLRNGRFGEFGV